MWGHWVDFCVQLFLNFYDILLISFCYEVDSQSDLTKPARSANSVQVGTAFVGEVEVDDNIDGLHINTSGNQIGADQSLELSFSESVEAFDSFLRFHVGVQILILIFLLV